MLLRYMRPVRREPVMPHSSPPAAERQPIPAPRAFSFAQLSLAARLASAAVLVVLIWCVLFPVLR